MTMVVSEEEKVQEEKVDSARARVRMVAFISRNGTRAQKRVISTGKLAGHGVGTVGRKALNQITAPYSMTKIALGFAGMVTLTAIIWYYSLVVCIMAIMMTGSVLLGIIAAVAFYMVMARFVYIPMLALYGDYCEGAANYRMANKAPRTINIGTFGYGPAMA
jgi:hypothetical protein